MILKYYDLQINLLLFKLYLSNLNERILKHKSKNIAFHSVQLTKMTMFCYIIIRGETHHIALTLTFKIKI